MNPESPLPELWNRKVFLGALAVVAGLLFLRFQKKHKDQERVSLLTNTILAAFPQAENSLMPLTAQKSKVIRDQKVSIVLGLSCNLAQKQKKAVSTKNPFIPPFEKGILISELPPSHRLLYNKYYFLKNHLLVVTHDYEEQASGLSKEDFKQSILVMEALSGVFFFNCGVHSGFSQKHKHIQILPQESLDLPILAKIIEAVRNKKSKDLERINYKGKKIGLYRGYEFIHGLIAMGEEMSLQKKASNFLQAYNVLHEHLSELVKGEEQLSYNLVGCKQFLLMIPRKKEKILEQVGINSVGFMGSIMVKDEKVYDQLEHLLSPSDILRELTFTEIPDNE